MTENRLSVHDANIVMLHRFVAEKHQLSAIEYDSDYPDRLADEALRALSSVLNVALIALGEPSDKAQRRIFSAVRDSLLAALGDGPLTHKELERATTYSTFDHWYLTLEALKAQGEVAKAGEGDDALYSLPRHAQHALGKVRALTAKRSIR